MTAPLGAGSARHPTPARLLAAIASLWLVYFVFGTSTGFGFVATWHDEQRLIQTTLLAVTALILVAITAMPTVRSQVPGLAWPVWGVLAVAGLSAVRARFPALAALEIGLFLGLISLAMVFATWVRIAPAMAARGVLLGVIAIAFTQEFAIAVRYAAAIAVGLPLDVETLTVGFANRRFASALYALLIPVLAAASVSAAVGRRWRIAAFALMAGLWAVNLGLGTRAVLFSFGLALPVWLVLLGWARIRRMSLALAGSFALGLLIYFTGFEWLPQAMGWPSATDAAHLAELDHASGRWPLWLAAWNAMLPQPWLGIGPMHYAALERLGAAHPHNGVMHWLSELGWRALSLVIAGLAQLLERGRRQAVLGAGSDAWLAIGAYATTVVAVIYGLVDGNAVMPVSQSAVAIAAGLVIGSRPADPAALVRPGNTMVSSSLLAAGALAVAGVAWQAFPQQGDEIKAFNESREQTWLA
ncbi:MAG: O-antigen ligase family protein, partial [Burkholderiaceae bacterium]